MSLPILSASNPTTVPSIVYDKWWITNISINAPSPNLDAHANVTLVKFATLEDGSSITSNEFATLEITNLLSNAQNDPELASVIGGLMSYINKIGQEKGIISTPNNSL